MPRQSAVQISPNQEIRGQIFHHRVHIWLQRKIFTPKRWKIPQQGTLNETVLDLCTVRPFRAPLGDSDLVPVFLKP
jgi:hypothetical protein